MNDKPTQYLLEKEIQEAYRLLGDHKRICRVINAPVTPPVTIKPQVGYDDAYTVTVGELTLTFPEKSHFTITLHHAIKNEIYNLLQGIEHRLGLLGCEIPSREKEEEAHVMGQTFNIDLVTGLRYVRSNWLKNGNEEEEE